MRMRENGMLLISSGQRRGEVLTEEFWSNCFVVRTKCQQARKDSRRDKATKPPASHGEECPGERCQQHTPAAALPPSPGVSSPAFSSRGHFIMVPIANSDVEDNTWGLRAGRATPRTPTPATWQASNRNLGARMKPANQVQSSCLVWRGFRGSSACARGLHNMCQTRCRMWGDRWTHCSQDSKAAKRTALHTAPQRGLK